jgi:hypothetical protein
MGIPAEIYHLAGSLMIMAMFIDYYSPIYDLGQDIAPAHNLQLYRNKL